MIRLECTPSAGIPYQDIVDHGLRSGIIVDGTPWRFVYKGLMCHYVGDQTYCVSHCKFPNGVRLSPGEILHIHRDQDGYEVFVESTTVH